MGGAGGGRVLRASLPRLALLWLAGIDLRITILAVPPLVPLIHRSLALDEKSVGILVGLPTLLFATMSVAGALVISRLGARRAVIAGLWTVAAAGALRGLGPSVAALFAMTFLMGAGVALIQPGFPTLVGQWFPGRTGTATAAYSNGILMGETLPPLLALSLVLPLTRTWEWNLAAWSIPVAAGALILTIAVPHRAEAARRPVRWWPDWRNMLTWRLGLILGGCSAIYWTMDAFIPDYLTHTGRGSLVAAALGALNAAQLLATLVVLARPGVVRSRAAFVAAGGLTAAGVAGFLILPGTWAVVSSGLVGLMAAVVYIMALALPPLLTEAHDVPRLSAAMFTIMYACAFLSPVAGGVVWDATGVPAAAFGAALLIGAAMTLLSLGLRLPRVARLAVPDVAP